MVKIILLDKNAIEVAKLKVEPKRVAEAGLIVYKGKHYAYGGLYSGPSFKFNEVSPPVDISDAQLATD